MISLPGGTCNSQNTLFNFCKPKLFSLPWGKLIDESQVYAIHKMLDKKQYPIAGLNPPLFPDITIFDYFAPRYWGKIRSHCPVDRHFYRMGQANQTIQRITDLLKAPFSSSRLLKQVNHRVAGTVFCSEDHVRTAHIECFI